MHGSCLFFPIRHPTHLCPGRPLLRRNQKLYGKGVFTKEHHNPLKKTTSAQQDALRSRDIPESGRHDQEAGIIRRSKPLEDHEEISHDSRLLGEHASFPKTREHKKKRRRCHEHDTTATESGPPASDRDHSQRLAGGCACRLLGSHAGGASHTFSGEVCKQKTFPETPVRQEAETLVNLSDSFTSCV